MKKRVLLLAVSCKTGGLCPGGIDLECPSKWIRIVRDDGNAGAVQGIEISFAKPLDVIEFDGAPKPMGKQPENWIILNHKCRVVRHEQETILHQVYQQYAYHGFWGNCRSYLDENEHKALNAPSESILRVTDINIYKNGWGKAKIDFSWGQSRKPLIGISMTDQDFYPQICEGNVTMEEAYIITSIPKDLDFVNPNTGERQAYKFVSKVYKIR